MKIRTYRERCPDVSTGLFVTSGWLWDEVKREREKSDVTDVDTYTASTVIDFILANILHVMLFIYITPI